MMGAGYGRGAPVKGLEPGDYVRGDVEDWLAEKTREEEARQAESLRLAREANSTQRATLLWAKIAGWGATLAVVVTLIQWLAPLGK